MKTNKRIYMLIAMLLVLALSLSVLPGMVAPVTGASSSADLKEQLEALQREKAENAAKLADLEKQISGNKGDVAGILREKSAIDQQIQILYEQTVVVNNQIAVSNQLIAQKQEELDDSNRRYNELNAAYKNRIRVMEEVGGLSYWMVLFNATSFSDFLDRLNMIKEIAAADQRRMNELKAAADAVAAARQELEYNKQVLEQSGEELAKAQAALTQKSAESDLVLQRLLDQSEDLDSLWEQFEKEEQEFLDKIAQMENEYNNQLQIEASIKASQQASKDASKLASQQASKEASKNQAATAPTGGGNSNIGANNPSGVTWLVPCTYTRVTSPFGYRWHPTTGEWTMHKGVDLGARKGTPIYASRSGVVTVATHHETAGNYVTINHQDGYRSTYMHMTYYVVKVNQRVEAGQLIGYVGDSGRTNGPHLHFGILYGDGYVDPMKYIG